MRSLHLVVVTLHNTAWCTNGNGFITVPKVPSLEGLKFFNSLRQQYSFAGVYVLLALNRIVTALSLVFKLKYTCIIKNKWFPELPYLYIISGIIQQ